MMNAGSSVHFRPHCFSVYPLTSRSYMSRPTSARACSSTLRGSLMPARRMASRASLRWLSIMAAASAGVFTPHMRLNVFMLNGRL